MSILISCYDFVLQIMPFRRTLIRLAVGSLALISVVQAWLNLVVAGMVMIGITGLGLDLPVQQLEKFDQVRWGHVKR